MPRPNRPVEVTLTVGPHAMVFTFCTICHAIVKVQLPSAPGAAGFRRTVDLIEDLHYDWHDRNDRKE
jgi:hypothetical protein